MSRFSNEAGIVILAAGASTRLSTPKQLLHYEGVSLLRRAAEAGLASACRPIVIVLGANAGAVRVEVENLPVLIVENTAWRDGMSTSICAGICALEIDAPMLEAGIITLCDQPFVSAEVINNLVEAFRRERSPVVASSYGDVHGVPALFARALFPELCTLEGGDGARQIIERHAREASYVSFAAGRVDIDTREDYARLMANEGDAPL